MKKQILCIVLLISALIISTTNLFANTCNLKLSSNSRFLIHMDDTPFFPIGDTAWRIIYNLNRADVETYLQTRKNQHFNIIGVISFRETETQANIYGDHPFVIVGGKYDPTQPITTSGNDPGNATEYDYWDHLEYLIDLAASKGIYVVLLPCWGNDCIVHDTNRIFDQNKAYIYGQWIGARFSGKTNIIWMMGGDTIPEYDGVDYRPVFRKMAEGVADGVNGVNNNDGSADYSTTLMSYHGPKWTHSSSYYFPNDAFMDFNSMQDQPSDQISRTWNDWGLTPAKPTWLFEGGYEGRQGIYGEWQCRFQAYQTVFAGGFGSMYGDMSIYAFGSGWATAMQHPGANDMQHVLALMSSLTTNQFLTRNPDQNLIDGNTGSMTGTEGTISSKILTTASYNRDIALIYSANGSNIRVKMDTLAGPTMDAQWFDPRNGNWSSAGTGFTTGAGAPIYEFDPPGSPADGNDWVLILATPTAPTPDPDPEPMPGITNIYYSSSTLGALPIQPRSDDLAQQSGSINLIMQGGMNPAMPHFEYLFDSDANGSYGTNGAVNTIFQDGMSPAADTIFHCDFASPAVISEIHIFTHWNDQRVFSWFEVWASTTGTNDADYSFIGTATLGEIDDSNTPYVNKECVARLYDPNDGIILHNVVSLKFVQKNCGYGISSGNGDKKHPATDQGSYVSVTGCTSPEIDVIGSMVSAVNEYYYESTLAALPIQPRNDDLTQQAGSTNLIVQGGMHSAMPHFEYLFDSDANGSYGTNGAVNTIFQDGMSPAADTAFHCDFASPAVISEIHVFTHWGDQRLFSWFEVWASTTGTNDLDYFYIGTATFGDNGESSTPYANKECVARLYDPADGIILSNAVSLKFVQKNCGYGISSGNGDKKEPGTAQGSYVSISGCTSPEIDVISLSTSAINEYYAAPTIVELPFQPRGDDLAQAVGTTKSIVAGGMHPAWGDNEFDYMFNSQAYGEYGHGSSNSIGGTGVMLWDAPSPNKTSLVMHIDFANPEMIKEIRVFSYTADVRLFNYGEVSYSLNGSAPYTFLGVVSFGNWGDLASTYVDSNCVARLYDDDSGILAANVKSLKITMRGICDNWTWDLTKKTANGGGSVINEIDVIGIPEPFAIGFIGLLGFLIMRRK